MPVDPEPARVPADVVQRQQPRVAIERRVLDALGHDRGRRLLEAGDELRRGGCDPLGEARLLQDLDVLGRGPVADVRAVDGQRGERALQVPHLRPEPAQPVGLGGERRRGLLELRVGGHLAESPAVAGDLLPQRGQRRLARRVDVQRGDVVEELVADRPLDRPVAELLTGIEDLLDPDVLRAALAQPLEVPGRIGEPVRMVDPQPVHGALVDQPQRQRVRGFEHLRVLLADAREVVDVEEPAMPPGRRVDVEELLPQLGVGPVAVGLVRGHVVRDDVEHDPQPRLVRGGDQRTERLLAAEL
jgi:hypothetical protein